MYCGIDVALNTPRALGALGIFACAICREGEPDMALAATVALLAQARCAQGERNPVGITLMSIELINEARDILGARSQS